MFVRFLYLVKNWDSQRYLSSPLQGLFRLYDIFFQKISTTSCEMGPTPFLTLQGLFRLYDKIKKLFYLCRQPLATVPRTVSPRYVNVCAFLVPCEELGFSKVSLLLSETQEKEYIRMYSMLSSYATSNNSKLTKDALKVKECFLRNALCEDEITSYMGNFIAHLMCFPCIL